MITIPKAVALDPVTARQQALTRGSALLIRLAKRKKTKRLPWQLCRGDREGERASPYRSRGSR